MLHFLLAYPVGITIFVDNYLKREKGVIYHQPLYFEKSRLGLGDPESPLAFSHFTRYEEH